MAAVSEQQSTHETHKAHVEKAVSDAAGCNDALLSRKTQSVLQRNYHTLGKWIARKPKKSMLIGAVIMISGMPGTFILPGAASLLWVKMAAGFEPFALKSTEQFEDRDAANALHESFFVPSHGRNSMIVISPRDPSAIPVFSRAFVEASLPLVNSIYRMQVSHGASYTFQDLCVPVGSTTGSGGALTSHAQCLSAGNDLFAAIQWNISNLPPTGFGATSYGAGAHDYAAPLVGYASQLEQVGVNASGLFRSLVGMPDASTSGSTPPDYRFWQPTYLVIPFRLVDDRSEPGGGSLSGACSKWIQGLQRQITSGGYVNADVLRVTFLSDQSVGDGLQELLDNFIPFLFLVFGIMAAYAELFLGTQTRTREGEATQGLLVLQGLVVAGSAGFSGMGWILYIGLEDIVIMCCMAVFLVLAVGVDCTFIFISAMKSAGPDATIEDAMGHTLSEGATAITLTTASSVGCFLASGLFNAAQPAFLKFNLTMSIALFINFLGFLFYFAGCMVLNERRIADMRQDLFPWKPEKKKEKGGALPSPRLKIANVADALRGFINETYAPLFVRSLPFKLGGALFMAVSVALAFVFVPTIRTGMAQTTFLVDSSPLYETYSDFGRLGGDVATQSTTVQVHGLNLTSPDALAAFRAAFVEPIRDRPETMWISCLPLSYLDYRDAASAGAAPVLPWATWLNADPLARSLFGGSYYPHDAGTPGGAASIPTTIECSIAYLTDVVSADASSRIDTMNGYYDVADAANAALAPHGASLRLSNFEWAIMTSLDKAAQDLCWSGIATAIITVMVILLFVLPLRRAIVSSLNIVLVVYCTLGFMGYAGISYNLLTLCVTAMGPGFCVDYTVEVMHFSSLGPSAESMGKKMERGMRLCGYDVLHGCVTGMLGVVCLMLCPGEAPRIFSFGTIVMIFYGGVFALWSLPAVLTLVDDLRSCHCKRASRVCPPRVV